MIKVIALANRKGSVGETTAAVNPDEIIYSTDSWMSDGSRSKPSSRCRMASLVQHDQSREELSADIAESDPVMINQMKDKVSASRIRVEIIKIIRHIYLLHLKTI